MICNNCGQHLNDGSAFCTNCGSAQNIAVPMEKAECPSPEAPDKEILNQTQTLYNNEERIESHPTVLSDEDVMFDSNACIIPEHDDRFENPTTTVSFPEAQLDNNTPVYQQTEEKDDYHTSASPYPEEVIGFHTSETPNHEESILASQQQAPPAIDASNPNIVTLEPVQEKPDVLVPQSKSVSGFTVFGKTVKAFFSVIFAIITFALASALTVILILQPANIPNIIAGIDVAVILDEPEVNEAIERWLADSSYSKLDLDINIDEIKEYMSREDLPNEILRELETAVEDSVVPYLFFSIYPLIIIATLCALAIFDIFMIHRKTARLAFLTAGIPVATSGLVFFGSGIVLRSFPGILWSRSLRIIAESIEGVSQLLFLYGLIVFAIGIVSIAVFFIIWAIRKTRRAKASGSLEVVVLKTTEAWRVTGIITNFTLLMACTVVLFLYYLNIPWR